ncbi:extracellular mutant protein 11-domain-containing protein [Xylaria nigripes]|nr:extracellular mutant protein 11-domain-containing protein [Xylaria nigripes]
MPPATASFFKQSRTKMQAWVTNNPGPVHSQPGVATSAPATTYDPSPPAQPDISSQSQPHPQPQPQPPTRHVNIPQPQPQPPTTQSTSPVRSRSPIVNANWQRLATAAAARMPMPAHSTHTQDGAVGLQHDRAVSSETLQQSKRPAPFWEGSTIEGSAFSDTASIIDSNAPFVYRSLSVQAHPALRHQQHENPRHRPAPPRQLNRTVAPPPFIIGSNGLINDVGNMNGTGLTRSASTPETRSQSGGFKEITSDHGRDPYSDESQYNTSPEKTPSAKRLQHPKTMTLRPTRRESYTEGISLAPDAVATSAMPSPPRPHTYANPSRDETTEMPQAQQERFPRPQVPEHQVRRSSVFLNPNMPTASRQGEVENASVEREPTPMPVTRALPKAKTQVNRQLFTRTNKGKAGLRDSAMPRPLSVKGQPSTKKRSYELDYDDGALAAMDYGALKHEAFDFDPAQAEARSVFESPRGTLPEKLEHFLGQDEANQANFFTKMSVKDWEESGDWLLERFGDIIDRFKEYRKEKREIVNTFENEIAGREEAVRNKIRGIGQTLTDLKSEGEGMMLGKM